MKSPDVLLFWCQIQLDHTLYLSVQLVKGQAESHDYQSDLIGSSSKSSISWESFETWVEKSVRSF